MFVISSGEPSILTVVPSGSVNSAFAMSPLPKRSKYVVTTVYAKAVDDAPELDEVAVAAVAADGTASAGDRPHAR
jgi:hypothetical protein